MGAYLFMSDKINGDSCVFTGWGLLWGPFLQSFKDIQHALLRYLPLKGRTSQRAKSVRQTVSQCVVSFSGVILFWWKLMQSVAVLT